MAAGTTQITQANFEQLVTKPGILFIDWWASWCGPCRAFAPVYEGAAAKHADVVWGKVDTDAQQELAGAFGIQSIPTLSIFRDGVLVFSRPGMIPAAALDELVTGVKGLDMDEVRRSIAEDEKRQAEAGDGPGGEGAPTA